MNLYNNGLYCEDVKSSSSLHLPWNQLQNSSLLISGATGLIGSYLIDVLMHKNSEGLNCKIYAISRDPQKAQKRFSKWIGNDLLVLKALDVNKLTNLTDICEINYVLHLASNTHPLQYATDPIGTILTNVIGLKNMLDLAVEKKAKRFLFTSSVEVYGENRGDVELFDEEYCGYIDSNTLRAGYPESKRCGETLCQAYRSQMGLDVIIGRVARSYGPTMSLHDSRAISQFILKGVRKEDIVLKSKGSQLFSYTYVADAASGLLAVLLQGTSGEAYNIADDKSNITLKDLAALIANYSNQKVVFDCPDSIEAAGYSRSNKALLDGSKIKSLGWRPFYSITEGIIRTIDILSNEILN